MCNQDYLRLLAGEPVLVTDVPYFNRYSGRAYALNVSVEKDHRYVLYIEVSMAGVKPVRIPHCYIFAKDCPTGFDPKQQNIWKVLRFCFRKEIDFYEAECEAKKEASRQELRRTLQVKPRVVLPPKGDMVRLPEVTAISLKLLPSSAKTGVSPKVETRLVPGVPLFDPDWDEQKLVTGPTVKPRGAILMSGHLTVANQGLGIFKLPTPMGAVWFTRSLSLGNDAYLLRLEDVPAQHCLYQHFAQEKKAGRKILVWINQQGPMSTAVGSPAWHLEVYLRRTLCEEPGQQRIAA